MENKGKIVTPNLLREELNKAQGKGPNIYRMNITEFKAKVAIEAIKEIKTIYELAQLYQVHPNLIGHWKKEFLANAGKVFNAAKSESDEVKKLKQKNEDLIHQIGQLSVDINWLKKKGSMIPLETRRQMIERDEGPMSICYQCELLGIARSSLYYTPSKASNKDLQLMEELDKLYVEDPHVGPAE